MNWGINAPKIIVVRHTMMRVVLLIRETAGSSCSGSSSMVKMSANATDPLMVPAIETIANSLELTVHFLVKI